MEISYINRVSAIGLQSVEIDEINANKTIIDKKLGSPS